MNVRSLEEWADYLASVGDNQGLDEGIPSLYEAAKDALSVYAAQVRQAEREACAQGDPPEVTDTRTSVPSRNYRRGFRDGWYSKAATLRAREP